MPLDNTLLVEAQVRPQDIGFIWPGQNTVVKITAYDSAIFGSLHGKVERISADTMADARGENFYRVVVIKTYTTKRDTPPIAAMNGDSLHAELQHAGFHSNAYRVTQRNIADPGTSSVFPALNVCG